MSTIRIGSVQVELLDYAVSCSAILGIRDSGKTVTAKCIAEQLLDHDIPFVVFDAVGKWRWLKVPGPGQRGKGYQVVVAGGRAPDLALTPHSVGEIVRSAIKERIPLVIDLYDPKLSKADWRRIVQQSIRIIHYEATGVAHVFLEEAAEFIPQKVMDGETYAEVEKLARMGGNASVGITLINQRSQEVNKAVLDLAHNLILGCQIGNKAIEAVEKWVDRLAPEVADAVTASLPRLKSGQAWVWTRSNPSDPQLEKMPMCRSLHPDRRTPDVVLKSATAIDTEAFVKRLEDSIPKVIEEAKANDPAELKRRIRELEKQIKSAPTTQATKEIPILTDDDRKLLKRGIESVDVVLASFEKLQEKIAANIADNRKFFEPIRQKLMTPQPFSGGPVVKSARIHVPVVGQTAAPTSNGEITGGMRRMMIALTQRGWLNKRQLGVRAGLSSKSGTFGTYLGKLRSNGWVTGQGDALELTNAGRDALGKYDPLPDGYALLEYWLNELGQGGAGRMLRVLAEAYPVPMDKETLGRLAEISHTSGTFGTYLGKLRTLELVEGRGEIRAAKEFFE